MHCRDSVVKYQPATYDFVVAVGMFVSANACGCAHLLDPGINAARKRANKLEIKHSRLSYDNSNAPNQ